MTVLYILAPMLVLHSNAVVGPGVTYMRNMLTGERQTADTWWLKFAAQRVIASQSSPFFTHKSFRHRAEREAMWPFRYALIEIGA